MDLLLWGIIVTLLAGAILKYASDYFQTDAQVSKREFFIGSLIVALIIVPSITFTGAKIAKGNVLKYNEFWNGYETAATSETIPCSEDGSCIHEYNCHPYEVPIYHAETTDGKGNVISPAYTTYETRYHACPYATRETSFFVDTTLGKYTIASHWFDQNPQGWEGGSVPGNVPRGTPPFWAAAKARVESGNPGGTTVVKKYDNYILASQHTILHKYSTELKTYQKILPSPVANPKSPIHDFYYADKVSFVGLPADPAWQRALTRFNAAFGTDKQGDLHIVLADAKNITKPDEFTNAVNAHWTGPSFGKNPLSKNALVIVLGVSDNTVQWARSFSGMPIGNEALFSDLKSSITGAKSDPIVLLGSNDVALKKEPKVNPHNFGLIGQSVWGTHAFHRVCMTCKNPGEHGGFTYLSGEVQPTKGQKIFIGSLAFFLSLILWIILFISGPLRDQIN